MKAEYWKCRQCRSELDPLKWPDVCPVCCAKRDTIPAPTIGGPVASSMTPNDIRRAINSVDNTGWTHAKQLADLVRAEGLDTSGNSSPGRDARIRELTTTLPTDAAYYDFAATLTADGWTFAPVKYHGTICL